MNQLENKFMIVYSPNRDDMQHESEIRTGRSRLYDTKEEAISSAVSMMRGNQSISQFWIMKCDGIVRLKSNAEYVDLDGTVKDI